MPFFRNVVGFELTAIRRMAIGTFILGISNACWALIEYWRLSKPLVPGHEYNDSGDYAPVHDLSLWIYLVPQFFSDLGQVGLWIGQTEWFYNEVGCGICSRYWGCRDRERERERDRVR